MRKSLGVALGLFAYFAVGAGGPSELHGQARFPLLVSEAQAASIDHQASLNGTLYTVIAPLFDGSTGTVSYIRLFNGSSTTSTFSVTVVNADTGQVLGTTQIQVPTNGSPQYPLTSNGFAPPGITPIFNLAGVTDAAGTDYALYIQNSNTVSGYQHVTFNNASQLFENLSDCNTLLDQQITSTKSLVLTNVHTSALGGGTTYPSVISIQNYWTSALTYQISVINSAAGGAPIVQFDQKVAANETVTIPESQIESQYGFHPSSTQYQINLIVTDTAGNPPYEVLAHSIHNAQLGGDIDMSTACAVNPISSGAGSGTGGLNGF